MARFRWADTTESISTAEEQIHVVVTALIGLDLSYSGGRRIENPRLLPNLIGVGVQFERSQERGCHKVSLYSKQEAGLSTPE